MENNCPPIIYVSRNAFLELDYVLREHGLRSTLFGDGEVTCLMDLGNVILLCSEDFDNVD